TLVVSSDEGDVLHVHDGKTFRETATWPTAGALASPPRFNPSGDRLAGVSWDARVSVIDTQTGRTLYAGPTFRDGMAVRWNPDGRRLAGPVVAGRIGIWEVG